jgi:hypothetical protein
MMKKFQRTQKGPKKALRIRKGCEEWPFKIMGRSSQRRFPSVRPRRRMCQCLGYRVRPDKMAVALRRKKMLKTRLRIRTVLRLAKKAPRVSSHKLQTMHPTMHIKRPLSP